MGNPAHTATQGVNLRIQGPKHPPMRWVLPPDVPCLPAGPHARRGRDRQPTGITRRRPHARSGIRHWLICPWGRVSLPLCCAQDQSRDRVIHKWGLRLKLSTSVQKRLDCRRARHLYRLHDDHRIVPHPSAQPLQRRRQPERS